MSADILHLVGDICQAVVYNPILIVDNLPVDIGGLDQRQGVYARLRLMFRFGDYLLFLALNKSDRENYGPKA